ncbi:MAG: leucine-rich repeat domain-containing protein [Clostridiales bacterium]|nr:leucine-rich repeat domain-containing protein [Clostridiales bacterium]
MISKSNSAKPDYMRQRVLGKLKSYTVPNGVTEILPYTFYRCGWNNYHEISSSPYYVFNGTQIHLPDSIINIGSNAFQGGSHTIVSGKFVEIIHSIPHIPSNLKTIGAFAFNYCRFPNGFILPNTVTTLGKQGLIVANTVDIPGSIKQLEDQHFSTANVVNVILRNGIEKLNGRVFEQCRNLKTVSLPNSITYTNTATLIPFSGCSNLESVTLEQGFNASIKLNNSTKYSHDNILSWFNALYDRSADTTNTLTIGSTNLAKMTAQEIAIATAKNWTIA